MEARKKEAEAEKKVAVIRGPGGKVMEDQMETATEAMAYWERVATLVRANFGEGRLVEETTWWEMVLIPKGKGEYHNIGLVEVVWKVVAAILNLRLTASTTYPDFLHGFRAGCGTGNVTLRPKCFISYQP